MNAVLTDDDRAAGLSVVKIDGEYYIDYTPVINARLHEVEQEFQSHSLCDSHTINDPELTLENIAWFIGQVNEYCPWDIKKENSWKMQFGNVRHLSDMSDPIAYNGQVVRAENLGNLTYGYWGRAMGWPAEILYLGGGVVNQLGSAWKLTKALVTDERDIWAWLNSLLNIIKPSVYSDGSYGDGENDYIFIKQGVELYDTVH